MSGKRHRDVVVIGAGVSGIYQIKRLIDAGFDAQVLEAEDDLGGTWYRNRYPGCRFDSESYTYGYSFSKELLNEWHWKERFSSQPENLRYLNFVVDKFDLRRHMRFNARVEQMTWNETQCHWQIRLVGGDVITSRFVIGSLGPLSVPALPRNDGADDFEGESFHTFHWPNEPVTLEGRRVGVIGTGATGIQVIAEIADKVDELKVFQRRPNWSTPLNNGPISDAEMDAIRDRYDEIFENCANSPGGFEHTPMFGFWDKTPEERRAIFDELYDIPGFAIVAGNFAEIHIDEAANRELSDYIADRIRERVDDAEVAEKLIPKDHGIAMQRLPLESNYFEAYNRDNVELVDLSETPIERITSTGIQTAGSDHEPHLYELDVIVYATGFDAITGAYDRIDICGVDGAVLSEKWRDQPMTYSGLLTNGFPNMMMVAGPQSVGSTSNYPRTIEVGVDWITQLLEHARSEGYTRLEAQLEAEHAWMDAVRTVTDRKLTGPNQGWFTGYNANVAGREAGKIRYHAYFGGGVRYRNLITELADTGYPGLDMA